MTELQERTPRSSEYKLGNLVGADVSDGDGEENSTENVGVTNQPETTGETSTAGIEANRSNTSLEHFVEITGEELISDLNAYSTWQEGLQQANQILTALPQNNDFKFIVQDTFGHAGTEQQEFKERLSAVTDDLGNTGMGITVELLRDDQLQGARAAYTSESPTDHRERIYLNSDWINQGATSLAIALALLEESGHSLDYRLNEERDSKGDEGAIFAKKAKYGKDSQVSSSEHIEDDRDVITINGQEVAAEFADPTVSIVFDSAIENSRK